MFPKYYVISQLKERLGSFEDLSNFHIVSVQHLLESSGSLFESLIGLGFMPDNIFLTGKIYSTHKKTQSKLRLLGINIIESTLPEELGTYTGCLEKDVRLIWSELMERLTPNSEIIILDDGGYTLKNVPNEVVNAYPVYGIEQTTSGIRLQNAQGKFPIINVAASAAKTIIEPPIVSEAVRIRLGKIIGELQPEKIGIVGFGHIGRALANDFKKQYSIVIYDKERGLPDSDRWQNEVEFSNSLSDLFLGVEVIIGATGQDISDLTWLERSNGNKTLISVSSGDVEFNTLLRNSSSYLVTEVKNPLQVLKLRTKNGYSIDILRGGLVANFTGEADSSPGKIIQVTRGLLFSAIIQILRDRNKLRGLKRAIMLDPELQAEVVKLWFEDQPQRRIDYSSEVLEGFDNIDWIKNRSSGFLI